MILAKDLPKYLWAEAINYATWLKNRLPSRAIPGHTPYELIHHTTPDLSQAHEFGAKIFVHVQEAGKLEARAEEALFVGIDAESKGYRVYWPSKRRVSVERNITFAPLEVVVAEDVQDEGESNVSEVHQPETNKNAPSVPDTSPSPSQPSPTPTPSQPRETRPRPPPGYYASLE
jgi:hypothetical protein